MSALLLPTSATMCTLSIQVGDKPFRAPWMVPNDGFGCGTGDCAIFESPGRPWVHKILFSDRIKEPGSNLMKGGFFIVFMDMRLKVPKNEICDISITRNVAACQVLTAQMCCGERWHVCLVVEAEAPFRNETQFCVHSTIHHRRHRNVRDVADIAVQD